MPVVRRARYAPGHCYAVVWSPFPVGDKPWRNFFQLEIDHLIATDHHGTILLIEGVDDTL